MKTIRAKQMERIKYERERDIPYLSVVQFNLYREMYGKTSMYAFGLLRLEILAAKEIYKKVNSICYIDQQKRCDGSCVIDFGLACRHEFFLFMLQGDDNDDGV